MKEALTFIKSRLDAFILSLLLPLLGMGCGVVSLFCDVCINKSFLITFVLFPLIAAALLALCIFSSMKRYHREVLSVAVLLLFAVLFFGGKVFGRYIQVERYKNDDVAHHYTVLSTQGEYGPYIDYPWYMTLIAYSDESQQIVYLSYCNTDFDYLTSLSDFLYEECGWKYIR